MAAFSTTEFNTQVAPMDAIETILKDYHDTFLSPKEALSIITAITIEWRQ